MEIWNGMIHIPSKYQRPQLCSNGYDGYSKYFIMLLFYRSPTDLMCQNFHFWILPENCCILDIIHALQQYVTRNKRFLFIIFVLFTISILKFVVLCLI